MTLEKAKPYAHGVSPSISSWPQSTSKQALLFFFQNIGFFSFVRAVEEKRQRAAVSGITEIEGNNIGPVIFTKAKPANLALVEHGKQFVYAGNFTFFSSHCFICSETAGPEQSL